MSAQWSRTSWAHARRQAQGAFGDGCLANSPQPGTGPAARSHLPTASPEDHAVVLRSDDVPLAVVIVSFNVRRHLAVCLSSLLESLSRARLDARVIVVDNASHDGSAEMVRTRFSPVDLIEAGENVGFARANNLALRALGFGEAHRAPEQLPEAVWLLNPDTEVEGEAPAVLLRRLREVPRVGAVSPRLRYGDGRFQHAGFAFPGLAQVVLDLFPLHPRLVESRLNGRYPRAWYERGHPFRVDMVLGAALMVRREAIQQVGLLDEGYFMYVEELDWCRRLKQAGWEIEVVPSACVVHHGGQSTAQYREEMARALWESRLRYYRKFSPRPYAALVRLLVRLGLAYRRWRGP
ncbi:MAG: glycosyltransferase family 2 protein [Ardenticatenia bacterium]|nr:glycosyltransferase family 2 protein [Ardenticatenia bacterium]